MAHLQNPLALRLFNSKATTKRPKSVFILRCSLNDFSLALLLVHKGGGCDSEVTRGLLGGASCKLLFVAMGLQSLARKTSLVWKLKWGGVQKGVAMKKMESPKEMARNNGRWMCDIHQAVLDSVALNVQIMHRVLFA